MKYVLALFAFMIYSPLALSAQWQENVHYTVLDAPQTDGKEVTEFFSFWCGACYRTESMLPPLKKALSEDTTFKKVHVNFMGFTTPQTQNAATQAMIIARLYKQEEAMQTALFNAIHQQRKTISGLDDIKAVFVAAGMDAADFDKGATSFAANNLVKRNNREVDTYSRYFKSVPTFVVNGRYQATIRRDMTPDDVVKLIVWLTNQ